jgi:hypothetical protein
MSFKQKETFEKLTLEEIEVENKNKIEKIKFSIEKSQKDMETLKIQKEKYLTFIETYFQNMETQLNSQIETLNFNIDVLEKKEAKNLEEILQISKQIEWIYSNENRDVILNVSKENLESIVKKSIKLVEGFKVPVEVYTKIDFLRHCNWEKVLSICEEYEEYNDLLIKVWKAEAMKKLENPNWRSILDEIIKIKETNDSYEMTAIGKAFTLIGDEESGYQWFKKASEDGNLIGQLNYSYSTDQGLGCEVDKKKAFQLCMECSENGSARATYNLGVSYETGEGCEQDLFKAFNAYMKASLEGFAFAQANLATCYLNGFGCEPNVEEAIYWLKKASETGFKDAIEALKEIEEFKKHEHCSSCNHSHEHSEEEIEEVD